MRHDLRAAENHAPISGRCLVAGRKTAAARAAEQKPVRERIADMAAAEEGLQALLDIIDEGRKATKKVSVSRNCVKCGCKHLEYAEIQDVGGAIKAAEFVLNQGLGRPGEDTSGKGGGDFVVKRFVVEPEG